MLDKRQNFIKLKKECQTKTSPVFRRGWNQVVLKSVLRMAVQLLLP